MNSFLLTYIFLFIAAWAHKRGFLTAKAGRTDVYRAGRFRKSEKEEMQETLQLSLSLNHWLSLQYSIGMLLSHAKCVAVIK